ALTIAVFDDEGVLIEAELASGEILLVPDDNDVASRSFEWNQNAGPDIPAGGLVDLDLDRDIDCELVGHGLEGLHAAVEAAFSEPLWRTGPVTGELALIDPLIACEAADVPGGFAPRVDNPEEIEGKIAVSIRGDCGFVVKYQ